MAAPSDVRLLKSHEWARRDGPLVAIGVSGFAIDELNREIVYLELPDVGMMLRAGEAFGVIEAVKAASDLYAPVSGKVVKVNEAAVENPMLVAESPYGEGWLLQVEPTDPTEWDALMTAEAYQAMVESGDAH